MILYLFAMEDEAKDVIKSLELESGYPFPLYEDNNNLISITGIGKTNASFVTSFLCGKYNISKIVNLGFVGAVGSFRVKDVLIVTKALYHDVDVTMFGYEKGQIPKMPTTYHSNNELVKLLPDYAGVTLYTGDYFMMEKIEDNYIADMEATAIFQVAHRLNIPMISIKVVSDIIGNDNHLDEYSEFEKVGSIFISEIYQKLKGVIL